MKKSIIGIVAAVMVFAMVLNMISSIGMPVHADITPVDKLLQNERLINVQDGSFSFRDISTYWAKDSLYRLSYMNILNGFTDGTMRPDKTLTREEFITMLARAIDLPLQQTSQQYYADVSSNQWSYQYIQAAKAAGLLNIYKDRNLSPAKVITREEMAVIASAVVKDIPQTIPYKGFTDLKSTYRYLSNVKIVTGVGIISGLPNGTFKPYGSASRAEAAVIILRLLNVKSALNENDKLMLQAFAEDYIKSNLTNSNQGTLSQQDLLLYSLGKENKQIAKLGTISEGLAAQGINLERSIGDFTAETALVTKYLAEVNSTFKLSFSTDGVSRDYNVSKKLYLKRLGDKWVAYNATATYSRANEITQTKKINLAWQHMFQKTPDMTNASKINGLNVISPTWFTLSSATGDIKSIADVNYTNWAHKNGYQVWALVTNDFEKDMTSQMLSSPANRAKAINSLIQYAKTYNLDGINVDFENMYSKDKDLFTQFVKELYAQTKPLGITLSVDVTVIVKYSTWSECYDRKALAQVSDYIALMAYDQYWSGSPVSGSVSQLSWVEGHLNKVLMEVPKEKLLLGMPFYTRIWKEQYDANRNLVVTSRAVSMEYAEQQIAENKASKQWDPVSGQYFSTYTKDGATYKIWLEDENSIMGRVNLANRYNLAGVASWKIGFEKPLVWDVITAELNKKVALQ